MYLFLELLQIALGNRKQLSRNPSREEWYGLFSMSLKQAVAGVTYLSIEKLSADGLTIPQRLLFEWISVSEQIKARNELLNKRCVEITKLLENSCFRRVS